MSETMMALGQFRFSMNTAAYQSLKHSQSYRWVSQERIQRRPALQYVGLGSETLSLSGDIYPHYRGGLGQIKAMRELGGKGIPLILVDGTGLVWGQWSIIQIDEDQSFFHSNGQPLKQRFQLQLNHYGTDL